MPILRHAQLPDNLRKNTDLAQRAGVEPGTLRPLTVDGKLGPKTLGASYFVPGPGAHPLVTAAYAYILARAQERGGNNRGPWVERFYAEYRPLGAWCAAFTSTVLREVYPDAPYTLGARRSFDRAKTANPESVVQIPDLRAGDILTWVRPSQSTPYAGHIGLVVHVEGGVVYTIEGNAGPLGAVRVWAYPAADPRRSEREPVWGAFRPDLVYGWDGADYDDDLDLDDDDDDDGCGCDGSEPSCEVCHA